MNRELALTLRDEITRKHHEGIALDQQLRDTLLRKLECTRETGILLDEAQDQIRGDAWREFTGSLPFDSKAMSEYLKFARKHSEPVTEVAQAMRCAFDAALTTGLLPFADGHGPQKLHAPNFFSKLTVAVQQIAAGWRRFANRYPVDQWRDEQKEQFCESLRPILAMHRETALSLKHGKH